MSTEKEKYALLETARSLLREHFDSVIIIVTYQDGHNTELCQVSSGNHFANIQAARQFIDRESAITHHNQRPEPPPDEADNWKES
jgi:hypothetical protein